MSSAAKSEFRGTARFQVRRKLGAGGMGVVYEAVDRESGEPVALKTLHESDPQALYRLKQEFRALRGIEHPNLIKLRDLVNEDDRWFFTMELLEGTDFLSWVRAPSRPAELVDEPADSTAVTARVDGAAQAGLPFNETRLRDGLAQLASGLFALHDAGKIHRDIKPSNIMVTGAGEVVLLDFGLATASDAERAQRTTTEGVVVGTVAYMAPEQAASAAIGPPADWYAVGVLLYEVLTGKLPFTGSVIQVLMDKQVKTPPPPTSLVDRLPADLVELCEALLAIDPEARPSDEALRERFSLPAVPVSARTSRITMSSLFVGRDAELAELRERFDATRSGAVVVRVEGDSGVGKSALLRHFTDQLATGDDALVLAGGCREREAVPYKALDEVVDALSRFLRKLPKSTAAAFVPPNASLLPRLFPVLGRVELIAQAPRLRRPIRDPHVIRARAFKALRQMLHLLAEHYPLVVVIDDIQWVDVDSLDALDALLEPPDAPPLLLLCSSRPVPGDERLQPVLASEVDIHTIELGPLELSDASELAAMLVERAQQPIDVSALASEARGHPLYIAELVRYTMTGERRRRQSPRLEDAIWERANALPEGGLDLLTVICLTGAPLPRETLRDAVETPMAECSRLLSALQIGNFVRSTEHGGGALVDAYHDRVREAVVANTADDVKRRWHGRIGVALESAGDEVARPELLFNHMRAAGEVDKAIGYAVEAARLAEEALAFDRAADLYRAVFELGAGGEKGGVLETAYGQALAKAGRVVAAAAAYIDAAALTTGTSALELRRRAAEHLLQGGLFDRGLELLKEVVAEVGLSYPESPSRALVALLIKRAQLRLRGLGFKRRADDEIAAADAIVVDVCWSATTGLNYIDPVRGGFFSTWHMLLALKLGDPYRITRGLLVETAFVSAQGAKTRQRTRKLLAIGRELLENVDDSPLLDALHLGASSFADFQQGRFSDAREGLERALQAFRDSCVDVAWETGAMEHFSLAALTFMGELARLGEVGPRYLRDAQERGDVQIETNILSLLSPVVHLARDQPEAARQEAQVALDTWSQSGFLNQHYMALASLVQTDLYESRGADALARCDEYAKIVKGSLLLHVQIIRGHWLSVRALAAIAAYLEGDRRPQLLKRAGRHARRLAREGARWCTANATLIRAGVSAARGERERAAVLYREAIAESEAASLGLQAASARRRLGQLLGGDEGAGLIERSTAWLREHVGAVDLEATSRVFAPFDHEAVR